MAKRTRLIDTLQEEEIQELKEKQKKDNSIVERKAPIDQIISKMEQRTNKYLQR